MLHKDDQGRAHSSPPLSLQSDKLNADVFLNSATIIPVMRCRIMRRTRPRQYIRHEIRVRRCGTVQRGAQRLREDLQYQGEI